MRWIEVEKQLPPEDRLVLCATIGQPITKYVVAAYDSNMDLFIDNDDYPYAVSHWIELPPLPDESV